MNGQMRNKARLLARASTLAILAAAGSLGSAQQAQAAGCTTTFHVPGGGTTVTGTPTCVVVDGTVTGDVTNKALVGDPGTGNTPFFVGKNITGVLANDGNIFGGFAAGGDQSGALTIGNGAMVGSILNDVGGAITSTGGNGIQIGTEIDESTTSGQILNGITNRNDITSGGRYGIAALHGSLSGGLTNEVNATISGGLAGVYIADTFGSWSGGIHNSGQISGFSAAIQMGDFGGGETTFSGDIVNDYGATIDSNGGTAILISNDIASFDGSVLNSGRITGASDAVYIGARTFNGNVINDGDIIGGGGGDFGRGLVIGASSSVNGVGGVGNAQITNHGLIRGHSAGLVIFDGTVNADVTNTPSNPFAPTPIIEATDGTGVILVADSWSGNVTNDGTIKGTDFGMVIGATFSEGTNFITDDFTGTITNNGLIQGSNEGYGDTGLYVGFGSFTGDIVNTGTILGDDNGLTVQGASSCCYYYGGSPFDGTITNSGRIAGNDTGVHISGVNFTGDFVNQSTGVISGGDAGVRFVGASTDDIFSNKGTFEGNFTNDGSIDGDEIGVAISFDTIDGDFTNNGYIEGGIDGVIIRANTITGNITNNGTIIGNGLDTGLHVIAGAMTGDVVNNDYLSAPSNALHVDIGTLNGTIINTGKVEATDSGAAAVLLEIGNGATFTNTDGGIVLGDILFGGKAAYDFVAEDGGIEGDLRGDYSGGTGLFDADTITVQNGEHYFFAGKASNFSDFTVDDGGVAVMGARFVGDSGGGAYSFSNVDNVNVNNGTLYIDNSTTLNVDNSYTQAAGGTLMFYLAAPGGEGFSDLTGTQSVNAGEGDVGQLIVGGTATLNGTIGGFLDPAYSSANPGLTEVVYNDVIIADGISGDFTTTALIANNSLFELDSLIDGNTVDLRVLRSSLGSISAPSNIVNTGDPFDANIAQYSGGGGCATAGFGWCVNRYAANEPGATSVMTDATPGEDPFAWLRAGNRTVGETAAWGRAVGVWGETDGDALRPGTDFSLGGAIVGIDYVFEPLLLAGVAAQWTTADIDFDLATGDAEVDSLEVGAYASYGDARLFVNANVSYIWHDFEVNRVTGPNRARGDYDGNTYSGYIEGGKTFLTDDGLRIQPLVALSYSHLETDAYTETGAGTLLNVSDADLDSLKSMIGARFAYSFTTDSGRSVIPEARILWSHEFMDDHASHLVDPVGGPVVWTPVDGEEFSRDTLVLGAGLTASLSASTTVFVDYDAGINSDITSHTVSAGFRTRW